MGWWYKPKGSVPFHLLAYLLVVWVKNPLLKQTWNHQENPNRPAKHRARMLSLEESLVRCHQNITLICAICCEQDFGTRANLGANIGSPMCWQCNTDFTLRKKLEKNQRSTAMAKVLPDCNPLVSMWFTANANSSSHEEISSNNKSNEVWPQNG